MNDWISVKDRLPKMLSKDTGEVVLIAKRARSGRKGYFVSMGYLQKTPGDSIRDGDLIWVDARATSWSPTVDYWMPLPKPPEWNE